MHLVSFDPVISGCSEPLVHRNEAILVCRKSIFKVIALTMKSETVMVNEATDRRLRGEMSFLSGFMTQPEKARLTAQNDLLMLRVE